MENNYIYAICHGDTEKTFIETIIKLSNESNNRQDVVKVIPDNYNSSIQMNDLNNIIPEIAPAICEDIYTHSINDHAKISIIVIIDIMEASQNKNLENKYRNNNNAFKNDFLNLLTKNNKKKLKNVEIYFGYSHNNIEKQLNIPVHKNTKQKPRKMKKYIIDNGYSACIELLDSNKRTNNLALIIREITS